MVHEPVPQEVVEQCATAFHLCPNLGQGDEAVWTLLDALGYQQVNIAFTTPSGTRMYLRFADMRKWVLDQQNQRQRP